MSLRALHVAQWEDLIHQSTTLTVGHADPAGDLGRRAQATIAKAIAAQATHAGAGTCNRRCVQWLCHRKPQKRKPGSSKPGSGTHARTKSGSETYLTLSSLT